MSLWRSRASGPRVYFVCGQDASEIPRYPFFMAEWISIMTLSTRAEAEILKGLLESSGIPCLIQADDAGGMQPSMASMTGVRIQVEKENAREARRLIRGPRRVKQ